MQNDWSYSGAFVIQFGPATDIEGRRMEGRAEHIASTRSTRFQSLNELLAFLAEALAIATRSDADDGQTT